MKIKRHVRYGCRCQLYLGQSILMLRTGDRKSLVHSLMMLMNEDAMSSSDVPKEPSLTIR